MSFLKSIITERDTWNVSDGVYDGNLFIMRYRPHLQVFCETGEYNIRFVITWKFESDNSILPAESELQKMEKIETQLINILEDDLKTILVCVYTSKNLREWHWYSNNIDETLERFNKLLNGVDFLPIDYFLENDPNWIEYKSIITGTDGSIIE